MRKFTSLDEITKDLAARKREAALNRRLPADAGAEEPRAVFEMACANIAAAFSPLGYRFAKSGPHFSRRHGPFLHTVSFQSSTNNLRCKYVALWIHATVHSRDLKAWHVQQKSPYPTDYVAGGQIGNLEETLGWSEWNLADPSQREEVTRDAIAAIQRTILPFFKHFESATSALALLEAGWGPGLDPKPSLELAMSYSRPDLAQCLLREHFVRHPGHYPEYVARLREYQANGLPPYRGGDSMDLAIATIRYDLIPP